MRVLVTGGTGFLGGHLVRGLRERGHFVRAMGRDEKACDALLREGIQVVRADLCAKQAMDSACVGVDAVCHVAALSAPWGKRDDFWRANVEGTANVVEACQRQRVAKLVHVSSPSVVFDGGDHVDGVESAPFPRRFLCHYSESKMHAELLVRDAQRNGLNTVILRPKAIFGPGDTTLLPRLLRAARDKRLPRIGAGDNRIDLTYVDNVVHAMVLALDAPAAVGGTYTITNGEHVRIWDLVREVLTAMGVDANLRRVPYRVVYGMAALMECKAKLLGGEPLLTRYTTAILGRTQTYNITAARRDLGYAPLVSVQEGVRRTLAWLREASPHA